MNTAVKAWWKKLSARIDALSLRERVFLFISVLATFFALIDLLWLSPAQMKLAQVRKQNTVQEAELLRLRNEVKLEVENKGGAGNVRKELESVKALHAELDARIAAVPSAALDATPLPQVLEQFLKRQEGLTLVRTATLAADPVKAEQDPAAQMGLNRQGLELTVSGPYLQLIRYVQTLERSLPALRWGPMKLQSEKQPPELTLQVSLVKVAK